MKSLLVLAAVSLLCSCASAPQVRTNFNDFTGASYGIGPTSANDPRLHSPRFYMDEGDELPAWARVGPPSNR